MPENANRDHDCALSQVLAARCLLIGRASAIGLRLALECHSLPARRRRNRVPGGSVACILSAPQSRSPQGFPICARPPVRKSACLDSGLPLAVPVVVRFGASAARIFVQRWHRPTRARSFTMGQFLAIRIGASPVSHRPIAARSSSAGTGPHRVIQTITVPKPIMARIRTATKPSTSMDGINLLGLRSVSLASARSSRRSNQSKPTVDSSVSK